jgi:hypothetical protein
VRWVLYDTLFDIIAYIASARVRCGGSRLRGMHDVTMALACDVWAHCLVRCASISSTMLIGAYWAVVRALSDVVPDYVMALRRRVLSGR